MAGEIVFYLKGKKPNQIPLGRLAGYMQAFASLVGETDAMLFSEIREGSTCISAKTKSGGEMSVARRRVERASKNQGPREACAAFRKLSEMAAADRAPARVTDGRLTIVHFPTARQVIAPITVIERGHLTGVLEGVYRDGKTGVKARIRPDGAPLVICTASSDVGRAMGGVFLDNIRVFGTGQWTRDAAGKWTCDAFEIEKIAKLSVVSLKTAIEQIRAAEVTWVDDPWPDMDDFAGQA